jgi:phage terminase large subunit
MAAQVGGELLKVDGRLAPKLKVLMEGYGRDGRRDPKVKRRRYYVAHGGRGSAKSWSFARAIILQCLMDPLRVLCVREIMETIEDSVHQLLVDQIALMGLSELFIIKNTEIICRITGATISYAGLRDQDAHKIKSYEGVDLVWVEEANTVTKRSWGILIPTIRAEGSEIWVTFNPELDSDYAYAYFVEAPPDSAYVVEVNWRDNPWFPRVLEEERRELKKRDPVEYEFVWEGKPRSSVVGAIYANELAKMIAERRWRPVPYDPRIPVHTIWDLGWNDQTAIIYAQKVIAEVRIIDYDEESFVSPSGWAKRIKDKPYVYGEHWLPHDGDNELLAADGKSMKKILKPLLGVEPKIIRRPETVEVPIRSARLLWPRVYMNSDSEGCKVLKNCLGRFRRAIPKTTGEPGAPVKDAFRHGADAFGGLGMIVDKMSNTMQKRSSGRLGEFLPQDRAMGM